MSQPINQLLCMQIRCWHVSTKRLNSRSFSLIFYLFIFWFWFWPLFSFPFSLLFSFLFLPKVPIGLGSLRYSFPCLDDRTIDRISISFLTLKKKQKSWVRKKTSPSVLRKVRLSAKSKKKQSAETRSNKIKKKNSIKKTRNELGLTAGDDWNG